MGIRAIRGARSVAKSISVEPSRWRYQCVFLSRGWAVALAYGGDPPRPVTIGHEFSRIIFFLTKRKKLMATIPHNNSQNTDETQFSQQDSNKFEFGIQRIYVRDLSYEAPNVPDIFRNTWQPTVSVDLQNKSSQLQDHIYEVVLSVTATVKNGDKLAFIAEVQQAGIFTVRDFEGEQLQHLLGSFCPGIIFPYARESITDLVTRGGFPQLYLAPVNFDAIYQQQLQQAQIQEQAPQEVIKDPDDNN
jgi:preprotein translocase subunit SecB